MEENIKETKRVLKIKKGWLYSHVLQFGKPTRAKLIKLFSNAKTRELIGVYKTYSKTEYRLTACYSKKHKGVK